VSVVCLSGRGLCDGLITRPEESYRLWCVLVCDLETSRMRRLKLIKGCKCWIEKKKKRKKKEGKKRKVTSIRLSNWESSFQTLNQFK
jgi:hypothetical protein